MPELTPALLRERLARFYDRRPFIERAFRNEVVRGEIDEHTVVRWMTVILQDYGPGKRAAFRAPLPESLK